MNLDEVLNLPFEWSSRTMILSHLPHTKQVQFAIFCANQVSKYIDTYHLNICLQALEVSQKFLTGLTTPEECSHISSEIARNIKSYTPQSYAAYYALHTAIFEDTGAAYYAGTTAYYAVVYFLNSKDFSTADQIKSEQIDYLKKLIVESMSKEDAECWLLTTSM